MKYTFLLTIIMTFTVSFALNGQDNTFNGTTDNNWDNASNWNTGKVPPSHIVQKITIAADCVVPASNFTNYTFAEGSTFQINTSITFTNNGTGTWTMNGIYDKNGTYNGNLVIKGTIEPGINTSNWVCGDSVIYDGQTYATVQIGGQCWMAENLNIGIKINSNSTTDNQTDNNVVEKYCYNNNEANCDTFGGLYQWNEMMQYTTVESTQGVCPTGWHLPSDGEWTTLIDGLGGTGSNTGSKMASNSALWIDGALENNPEFGTSGLAIFPAGYREYSGSFSSKSNNTILWSSSEGYYNSTWWDRRLHNSSTDVGRYCDNGEEYGFSIRCIRD